MSKKDWRFDPNEDYSNYDDDDGGRGGRKGFQGMKNTRKWHNDKFDGKRARRDNNHRRGRHW